MFNKFKSQVISLFEYTFHVYSYKNVLLELILASFLAAVYLKVGEFLFNLSTLAIHIFYSAVISLMVVYVLHRVKSIKEFETAVKRYWISNINKFKGHLHVDVDCCNEAFIAGVKNFLFENINRKDIFQDHRIIVTINKINYVVYLNSTFSKFYRKFKNGTAHLSFLSQDFSIWDIYIIIIKDSTDIEDLRNYIKFIMPNSPVITIKANDILQFFEKKSLTDLLPEEVDIYHMTII